MDKNALSPAAEIAIEGATYRLTGNVSALAEAESWFNSHGQTLDLFAVFLGEHSTESVVKATRQLFPCMLHAFHPAIDYAAAQSIIDRAIASDVDVIFDAVRQLCEAASGEKDAVNSNLLFDLDGLAAANEHFEGKSGISWICWVDGLTALNRAWRVFPCAVHRFQPELGLAEARSLMTWQSVALTIASMQELEWLSALESLQKFAARLWATASDEERENFTLQVLASWMAPGAPQA